MGTTARNSSTFDPSKLAPSGPHVSVCVGVIDIGTQFTRGYQGKPDSWVYKVMLVWELSDALMPDGRTYMVNRKVRLSMHEKSSLRQILQSWRGSKFSEAEAKEFDVKRVLGAPCMLNIVHTDPDAEGTVYANVDGVTPLHPTIAPPEPVNPLLHYSIEDGEPEKAGLPEWICKVIHKSKEFGGQGPSQGTGRGFGQPNGNQAGPADDKFPWEGGGQAGGSGQSPAPFDETTTPRTNPGTQAAPAQTVRRAF